MVAGSKRLLLHGDRSDITLLGNDSEAVVDDCRPQQLTRARRSSSSLDVRDSAAVVGHRLLLVSACSSGSTVGLGRRCWLLIVSSCSRSHLLLGGECGGPGGRGWLLLLWRGTLMSSAAVAAGQLLLLRRCNSGSSLSPGGKGWLLLVSSCSRGVTLCGGGCSGPGGSGWLLLGRGGSDRGASSGSRNWGPLAASWWLPWGRSSDGATGGGHRTVAGDGSSWLLCERGANVDGRRYGGSLELLGGSRGLLLQGGVGTSCINLHNRTLMSSPWQDQLEGLWALCNDC